MKKKGCDGMGFDIETFFNQKKPCLGMNACKYEHSDRKCYHPLGACDDGTPDWCVEGPCPLSESSESDFFDIDEESKKL